MQIEQIDVHNYRLFYRLTLSNLPSLVVLVGANGTGKSTLFDVFSFLKDALASNVARAVARRGGFRELVSRGIRGPIEFRIRFRESGGRLASYFLSIGTNDKSRVVVKREVLNYRRGMIENWHISDFAYPTPRSSKAGFAEHLSTPGDNVAQVAQYLYDQHPDGPARSRGQVAGCPYSSALNTASGPSL